MASTAAQEMVSAFQPAFIARHPALTPNPSPDRAGEGSKNSSIFITLVGTAPCWPPDSFLAGEGRKIDTQIYREITERADPLAFT